MLSCNKDYSNKLDEKFKKWLKNRLKFSYNDINKFILLFRKGIYPYEYMDDWEKATLPEKNKFYSNLNMKHIMDADYMRGKRVCRGFEMKNLGEYHDFYIKSDALLLTDVFKNSKKICLKVCHLDPVKIFSAPWLALQASFKKTEVKLELLTHIDMLLMVEKEIIGGICHAIHQYAKAIKKYIKDSDKNKESSYLRYWDVINLYSLTMSQKFPLNKFEWIEDTSQFNEDLVKNPNEKSDEWCFFEVDVQYPEKLHELDNDLPFLPERMKIEKVEKLVTNLHDKTEYVIHMRNLKQELNHGLILKKFIEQLILIKKLC